MSFPKAPHSLIAVLVLSASSFVLPSCGVRNAGKYTSDGVDKFHERYNAEKYSEILAAGSAQFKASGSEEGFYKFMRILQNHLGAFKSGKRTGWRSMVTQKGTEISVTFDSEFSKGEGTEQFMFIIGPDSAILEGYHVDSPNLMVKE